MTLLMREPDINTLGLLLREGAVVAYPTESVFGLGCNPLDEKAVRHIYEMKQRSPAMGFLLIGAEFSHVEPFIDMDQVPKENLGKALATWPGPATWIFPMSQKVPSWFTGKHKGIALRVTAHPPAAAICNAFGGALVSTSANPHGEPPARDAQTVQTYFPLGLAAILNCAVGNLSRPTQIRDALTGSVFRA